MLRCLSLCERQFDVEVLKVVVRCSKLAEDGGREHAFKERARCDRLEPPIEAHLLVYERGELERFSAESVFARRSSILKSATVRKAMRRRTLTTT